MTPEVSRIVTSIFQFVMCMAVVAIVWMRIIEMKKEVK